MPFEATVDRTEADSVETLDLQPAYRHEWNAREYVRVAVLPEDGAGAEGTCSVCIVQFSAEWRCKALQAALTADEIGLLIQGLEEARRRMAALPPASRPIIRRAEVDRRP